MHLEKKNSNRTFWYLSLSYLGFLCTFQFHTYIYIQYIYKYLGFLWSISKIRESQGISQHPYSCTFAAASASASAACQTAVAAAEMAAATWAAVTFLSPNVGGSLNNPTFPKGHVFTIPKKGTSRIARLLVFWYVSTMCWRYTSDKVIRLFSQTC